MGAEERNFTHITKAGICGHFAGKLGYRSLTRSADLKKKTRHCPPNRSPLYLFDFYSKIKKIEGMVTLVWMLN